MRMGGAMATAVARGQVRVRIGPSLAGLCCFWAVLAVVVVVSKLPVAQCFVVGGRSRSVSWPWTRLAAGQDGDEALS
eukprot:CAMPEP_0118992628 /NCGR_PEP_ID=MMETSP1173-20130426/53718_1 /TAXON_ID=1034831 /ORGANISM="Rhizochromulina marina cf, Strain CCMP1243" /LENGTH=76 /DNA_ID=CAMNT_0006943827 /DNA_START=33 /DNA_END=260 /DNA_ORIENTATION=-